MREIGRMKERVYEYSTMSRVGLAEEKWQLPPVETLGGFDPPIQHHPYGHSTANRVSAVGRNKIDPVNLDLLLPLATDAAFGPIRACWRTW